MILRGISCALVERYLEPQRIPKGQNLTPRTLERFYFWGIVNELRAARVMPLDYPMSGIIAYGNLMSEHWYAPPQRELLRPYYFQANERLPLIDDDQVLETVTSGGIVGEMALVSNDIRSATVRAVIRSIVVPVDDTQFIFLVQQSPFFAIRIMRVMSARLKAMNDRLISMREALHALVVSRV